MRPPVTDRRPLWLALGSALVLGLALRVGADTNIWLATGGAAIVMLAAAVATLGPKSLWNWLRPTLRGGAVGIAVAVVMAAFTWLAYGPVVDAVPALADEVEKLYARLEHPPGPLAALPLLALIVAFEEVVFRGPLLDVLTARLGAAGAVAVSVLIYALPQVVGAEEWALLLLAVVWGTVWSVQRVVTGSLFGCVVSHFTWNLLVMVLFPLA